MQKKLNLQKLKMFFKKNMYFIIMGVSVLAIGAMITVAVVTSNSDAPTDTTPSDTIVLPPVDDTPVIDPIPDTPVDNTPNEPTPIVFISPVSQGTIIKDYTMDTLVYSSTLKQYQVHNGIDFAGEDGAVAVAVYAGTVENITYDVLNGTVVTINHGNGLVTEYASLADPTVSVGQVVTQGTTLGSLSTSATSEMNDGVHLHFTVFEGGQVVSPHSYLTDGNK